MSELIGEQTDYGTATRKEAIEYAKQEYPAGTEIYIHDNEGQIARVTEAN